MKLPDWLHTAYERVETFERQGRMPHALLLCGPYGIGLEHLADAIAVRALGEPAAAFPELRLPVLAHADLRLVQPATDKASHSVETIRDLDAWLHLTPQLVGRKVVVMSEAHRMSRAASNGFLKTLEEPPLGSLVIMVTHAPTRLLPTIRSRLQRIDVRPPSVEESVAWIASRHEGAETDLIRAHLFEAGGAPLAADQALFRGVPLLGPLLTRAVKSGQHAKLIEVLCAADADAWLSVWMRYCVLALTPLKDDPNSIAHMGLDPGGLWQFWCRLTEVRRMLHEGIVLNTRLTAENLVTEWSRLR